MPRDYNKTVIYRIPVGDENYYGHTTTPLHKRKTSHKIQFKKNTTRKVYQAMRDQRMTENDIELVWVEDYPCENVYQARSRERFWIERDGTLNTQVPNRTATEWFKEKWLSNPMFRQKKFMAHQNWVKDKATDIVYMDKVKCLDRQRRQEKRKKDEEWRLKQNEKSREYKRNKWVNDAEYKEKERQRKKISGMTRGVCDECGKELRRDGITYHKKHSCKGKTSCKSKE